MMKLLGKIATLLLAIIFGFWLATTRVLDGTQAGEWMDTIMEFLPQPSISNGWNQLEINLPDNLRNSQEVENEEVTVVDLPASTESASETSEEVNYAVVEETILHLLNELRIEQGLNTLTVNEELRQAGNIRAIETEELFSHTRPDGTDAFTVFNEEDIEYNYQLVGENLGMATYYLDERGMAELLFNGWVESEGHYENMIRPEYEEIGIGVHYDGENLYATQIFGTRR